MISNFWRSLKEGFHGVFRHGAMSLSAATAVTITLLIISLFSIFTANVKSVTESLEQSVQISVQVDYDYEAVEEEDRIALAIQSIDGVGEVNFSSKDEEYQYYLDNFTDEETRKAFEPLEGDENPMHDSFYVTVKDGTMLSNVAEQISAIEGVSSVNFGGASATELVTMLRGIRYGGAILALALGLLALFLIQNTIKLTILARADEIAIMRNVGAKNGYIRSPFLVEGVLIGLLGALIPMGLTWYGYHYLYEMTGGYVISQMFSLLSPEPFARDLILFLMILGMAVGWLGSFFSVNKYLRWKR